MKLKSLRFGELELPDDRVIHFPDGLPGFRSLDWVLLHQEDMPVVSWLQAVDEPEVALMTIDPADLGLADYRPVPPEEALAALDGTDPEKLSVRIIIRRAEDDEHLRLNLFAPLFFDVDRRVGLQVPLVGSDYPVSALWPPELEDPADPGDPGV